jgi:hypothetical protein
MNGCHVQSNAPKCKYPNHNKCEQYEDISMHETQRRCIKGQKKVDGEGIKIDNSQCSPVWKGIGGLIGIWTCPMTS